MNKELSNLYYDNHLKTLQLSHKLIEVRRQVVKTQEQMKKRRLKGGEKNE